MARRRTKSDGLTTILLLFLLIPVSYGIYRGGKYLVDQTSSENNEIELNTVDIVIDGKLIKKKEATHTFNALNEVIKVYFYKPNTTVSLEDVIYIDFFEHEDDFTFEEKIIYYPNETSQTYFEITINDYAVGSIYFTNANNDFEFNLKLEIETILIDEETIIM